VSPETTFACLLAAFASFLLGVGDRRPRLLDRADVVGGWGGGVVSLGYAVLCLLLILLLLRLLGAI
jgi:hypothetical protein